MAVTIAAAKLRRELLAVAARLLQTAPDRLTVTGDRVMLHDEPDGPSLDLAAIARSAGGELTADATFTAEHMTYPCSVHAAQVRIERDSAAIAVERFVGYDIGRAVNPMLVEGQIASGAAQGIGGLCDLIDYVAQSYTPHACCVRFGRAVTSRTRYTHYEAAR